MPSFNLNGLPVTVLRKDVRRLRLTVKAPDGRVEVSAPVRMSDQAIRDFVVSKEGWIRTHREQILRGAAASRLIDTGGRLPVWGKVWPLRLIPGERFSVVFQDGYAYITVRPGSTKEQVDRALDGWYREQLDARIRERMPVWAARTGLEPKEWHIKKMTTRWGSCSIRDRRIWLALRLAEKPAEFLDSVILHELIHLRFRNHDREFYAQMDHYMPGWREIEQKVSRNGE